MRILFVVPDGVGVRNYIFSSLISEINAVGGEVAIYHKLPKASIDEIKKLKINVTEIREIPKFKEGVILRLLRESLTYSRILRNKKVLKNETIMVFWVKSHKRWKQKILYGLAELFGGILSHSYKLVTFLDGIYEKLISRNPVLPQILQDMDEMKPDIVLNLHQRAPVSTPVIVAAKIKKIKTCTVIYSWDNIPKARMIARYDKYLAWSDLMKSELQLLHPEIEANNIKVAGSPQFEFYFDNNLVNSREKFFRKYGLDTKKQTICFSANDLSSPYEPDYLKDFCQVLSTIDEPIRPQILFRRCPVDSSDRFDSILEKYSEFVIPVNPEWRSDNDTFTGFYPTINDTALLVNTVMHCDAVINLGSTMAHDFAVYNKPCLYLNYNPVADSKLKVEICYQFQHFQSMQGIEAVGWINSKDEIKSKVLQALSSPDSVGMDRQVWLQKIIEHPLQTSSKRITDELFEIVPTSNK